MHEEEKEAVKGSFQQHVNNNKKVMEQKKEFMAKGKEDLLVFNFNLKWV